MIELGQARCNDKAGLLNRWAQSLNVLPGAHRLASVGRGSYCGIQLMLKMSPETGFWKFVKGLKLKGYPSNHKRIYRVYCRLGMNLPCRIKRALPKRPLMSLSVESKVNHQWALDFMRDTLYCGKGFRVLNIID